MLCNRETTLTEAISTVIVIVSGAILAAPLMFTAGYFVLMFG